MNRREFLWASAGLSVSLLGLPGCSKPERLLAKRPLGRTGEKLSIVGLGGVVLDKMDPTEARRLVSEVMDLGLNYLDVAPSYGNAEEVMGRALEGRRDKVFLACKTLERGADGARRELETSLRHLRTDHIDLYQFHALGSLDDVEKIFGPGGAAETFVKARQEGLIRFIGFSAHSVKAALEAMDRFDFDTILFPVNFVLYFKENFGPQVVEKARQKGMGVLALKSLAFGRLKEGQPRVRPKCWYEPITDRRTASLALRFTLSQEVTAAVPPGDPGLFRMAVELATDFRPIETAEETELKQLAQDKIPIFRLDV